MEQLVTLEQVLAAREARCERIAASLDRAPLISFTMNIAGPQKNSPLIRRGFSCGLRTLADTFAAHSIPLTLLDKVDSDTGCEALLSTGADALRVKSLCAAIEDADALGRLFDIDVIDDSGRKLDRSELGLNERGCMICGAPGRGCAARRIHSVEALRAETDRRLAAHFLASDRRAVEVIATQSLLAEVHVTPKPGLVDRSNNGSHADMDLPLFEKSAAALSSCWGQCFEIGAATAALAPEETFSNLREAGLAAEQTMLAATGGVNTHKGAIFLLGTLCGAVGRLWNADQPCRDAQTLCRECARMTAAPLESEFAKLRALGIDRTATAGARLYLQHGLRGARGECADGLPGVLDAALPALKTALDHGCSLDHAAAIALLHLIARGTDTNMVKRGGTDGAAWGAEAAKQLLKAAPFPAMEQIEALDRSFIENNLSPGGCADLLAVTLFLHRWEQTDN